MVSNSLQELIKKAFETYAERGRAASGLLRAKLNVEERMVVLSIQRTLAALGLGFAVLAIVFKDSWVNNSPVFNVVGAVVSLIFLSLCWTIGGLWWLITGSKAILVWAWNLLPWCIQPYRSASAIVAVFMAIVLFTHQLLQLCNQLPRYVSNRKSCLVWLLRGLRLLAMGVWIAVIVAWLRR